MTDISDDGLTVVGALQRWGTTPHSRAFRWTRETGVEPLPLLLKSDTRSAARSISKDVLDPIDFFEAFSTECGE